MNHNTSSIVSKVWPFCNSLRKDCTGYTDIGVKLTFEKIDKSISQSLQQTKTSKQSFLEKAFDGRLV